ncbi:hypothetical protein ZEAMMB73_Zm00001d025243 [Zea mays]|jgi:typhasterol/6-deoxotyphasterol 2alpha-hydroxylase|uniref:Uncharacterized protein n=1 Tax=Zea mays TaxID=4577 RepID=A0A1D6J5V2_MAIZE|nr:hypothetical protein ZEAMMB73_Zm00001d025243 [Zea mays]
MSLRFGSFPIVVGSSVEVAEVLLKTQDLANVDWPRMACGKHTVYNYSGMLWSHYGPYWRQLRKSWVTELLSARQLRLTERVRAEEVRAIIVLTPPVVRALSPLEDRNLCSVASHEHVPSMY